MATLNVYAITPGKPMVYSLESARKFLASTKNPLYIRNAGGWFEIHGGAISSMVKVNEWTDFEIWRKSGEEAVKTVYRLRKIINARFKD